MATVKRAFHYAVALLAIAALTLTNSVPVGAAPGSSLVIAQIQAGADGGDNAATQEYISLYNNTSEAVDVTDWCLSNDEAEVICITPPAENVTLYLDAYSYMTIVSDSFLHAYDQNHPEHEYQPDATYSTTNNNSGSITAGNDTISLINADDTMIDSIQWQESFGKGNVLQRNSVPDDEVHMLDTDQVFSNNEAVATDFTIVQELVIPASGIYEVLTLIDVCANLDGVQETIPVGLLYDAASNCVEPSQLDVCPNIADIQLLVPIGYQMDETGNCQVDSCTNLVGLQPTIPVDYIRHGLNDCLLDLAVLHITELLPNAEGRDEGHEFIELYNPNDWAVSLANYRLLVGLDDTEIYTFPIDVMIEPKQYMAFYNNEITFTLLNTTSQVALTGSDGAVIHQASAYSEPKDETAWALIDEVWQYTDRPTFAEQNMISLPITKVSVSDTGHLKPCASNQYRNPQTNRCRLLVTKQNGLTACKIGQYRHPETNRCRNTISTSGSLKPCKANQYRSAET
ncbi:MAG TPA: lamin tail domain-containing protein, partial [Candidatus Saccharimonadales bacterium]|nr:lamin tail domain-containing protein [Candidatus Saccharimonadales bacterium]